MLNFIDINLKLFVIFIFPFLHNTNAINFLVIGNWASKVKYDTSSSSIAFQLSNQAVLNSAQFVVTVGDNFSPSGVESVIDDSWKLCWKKVFIIPYKSLAIPWYAVLGDADYGHGFVGAVSQITRHMQNQDKGLWAMKSFDYNATFELEDGGDLVILFLDTAGLLASRNATYYDTRCSNFYDDDMLPNICHYDPTESIRSLFRTSFTSNTRWILVVGHHPLYSSGYEEDDEEEEVSSEDTQNSYDMNSNMINMSFGETPTYRVGSDAAISNRTNLSFLRRYLLPLFEEYNVHAYISGHHHISEHLRVGGMEYFVAGAGLQVDSETRYSQRSDDEEEVDIDVGDSLWLGSNYSAFADVEVGRDNLTIAFINTDGRECYRYTFHDPHVPAPTSQPTYFLGDMIIVEPDLNEDYGGTSYSFQTLFFIDINETFTSHKSLLVRVGVVIWLLVAAGYTYLAYSYVTKSGDIKRRNEMKDSTQNINNSVRNFTTIVDSSSHNLL